MAHKHQIFFLFALIIVVGLSMAAFTSSEDSSLAQGGMGMDTATPALQETPTPTWVMGPYGYVNTGGGMMGGGMMGGGMMGSGLNAAGTPDANGYSMGGCPMMSGMTASSGITGMGMTANTGVTGMGLNAIPGANTYTYSQVMFWQNPWILLGWVLLAVVACALLAGIVLGIFWLVRRIRMGSGS